MAHEVILSHVLTVSACGGCQRVIVGEGCDAVISAALIDEIKDLPLHAVAGSITAAG